MHLACVLFHMTMSEALTAATINAAASLGKSSTHGSLEIGKRGDLLVLNAPRHVATQYFLCCLPFLIFYNFNCRWEHVIYQFGEASDLIKWMVIDGTTVHENSKS